MVISMDFETAHRAIKRGDLVTLRQAIPSSLSSNVSNRFGWTLLMLAATDGNLAIGEFLISIGADVNCQNDFAETPITLAACGGHLRFVQLLQRHGAAITNLRPHGHDLPAWVRSASGLPEEKIAEIMNAINPDEHR